MNHFLHSKLLLAMGVVVSSAIHTHAHAQSVHASQLLAGGTTCHHVIRLMQLHGVNNSFDTRGSGLVAHHSPFGAVSIPDAEFGDLEIMHVNRVAQVDAACGPQFNVAIRNCSTRKVCGFHISVVAALSRICPTSPNSTVKVGEICAGETLEVSVQLPIEALAMGNRQGQVIGFQRLVVAIDSFDELVETNEANNLKAFACHEIPLASVIVEEATEVTTAQPHSVGTNVVAPGPGGSTPAAPAAATPGAVGTAPDPATPRTDDPLRSAIRMIDNMGSESPAAS